MPRIRSIPEEFFVEEIPHTTWSGDGPHTMLWIEKRLVNTHDIVKALSAATTIPPVEIGFAGRKDRNAVTRQWFSVPRIDPDQALALELGTGVTVLDATRHAEKLRVGQLSGNRFELVVRDVDATVAEHAEQRLTSIREKGLINRFGSQRFG
ncbi:MAG: tRNA pseudouridine(13) synthase TruD, partial [Acidobacteriota bacterium]